MAEKVLIVGGSSGIGAEMARQLAKSGSLVMITGRNEAAMKAIQAEFPEQIQCLVQDVTQPFQADELLEQASAKLGGLDCFVYSAGIMPPPVKDVYDSELDLRVLEVNVRGAVKWINAAADFLQKQGHGSIVALGSCAGDRAGKRLLPAYNASKAYLHTFCEGTALRLANSNVKVVIIKPGPVDTPLTKGGEYPMMMSAPDAAKRILAVRYKPGVHYLKITHRLILWVIRNMPTSLLRRLPY